MSRGGRGGGVRGGHGGGGVGRGKIGADVPGYDPEVEKFLSWKPLEKFPVSFLFVQSSQFFFFFF